MQIALNGKQAVQNCSSSFAATGHRHSGRECCWRSVPFCWPSHTVLAVLYTGTSFDKRSYSLGSWVRKGIVKRGVPKPFFVDNREVLVWCVFGAACATPGIRHLIAASYKPPVRCLFGKG